MDYSHSIAIARDLLSAGRHQQAFELLRSVEESEGYSCVNRDDAALLKALSARAILLGRDDVAAALTELQVYRSLAARACLGSRARSEVSTWLGWTLGRSGDARDADLALTLLSDASRFADEWPSSDVSLWAAIGAARVYARLGNEDLSALYARAARARMTAAQSPAAARWLEPLFPDDERPGTTAKPLSWHGPENLVKLMVEVSGAGRPVLLVGESGVGKTHAAGALLTERGIAESMLRVIDCRTLTGPDSVRDLLRPDGDLETQAWYLEDIAHTRPHAQRELLDFIQSRTRDGDIVIAGSTQWLDDAVIATDLDESFYVHLQACSFEVPPLRARRREIPSLVRAMARSAVSGDGAVVFTDQALRSLSRFDWPGNVDELRAEVERLLDVAAVDPLRVIDVEDLSSAIVRRPAADDVPAAARLLEVGGDLSDMLDRVERDVIRLALDESNGHVASAARTLGVSRQGLYKKMKRLSVNPSGVLESAPVGT